MDHCATGSCCSCIVLTLIRCTSYVWLLRRPRFEGFGGQRRMEGLASGMPPGAWLTTGRTADCEAAVEGLQTVGIVAAARIPADIDVTLSAGGAFFPAHGAALPMPLFGLPAEHYLNRSQTPQQLQGLVPAPKLLPPPVSSAPLTQQQQQQCVQLEGQQAARRGSWTVGSSHGAQTGARRKNTKGGNPLRNSSVLRATANDYSQHFVDTGQRPQNFLRDAHLPDLYSEYPKLKQLSQRKDELVAATATPPYYLRADLHSLELGPSTFGTKFDVVLVDPPWEEYERRAPGVVGSTWHWQEICNLDICAITDTPSFVFLWCGSSEGLDAGRHCLKHWGFRRCEDIVWVKTNKDAASSGGGGGGSGGGGGGHAGVGGGGRTYLEGRGAGDGSVLVHTKEHCLMGIKGTVRRSSDGHIVHANIDTDVIVSEEPPSGSTRKPEDMYALIERFALGRRRLELFGEDHNVRPGWVTVGADLSASNFDPEAYASHFRSPGGVSCTSCIAKPQPGAPHLTGTTPEIEALRPKSPSQNQANSKC